MKLKLAFLGLFLFSSSAFALDLDYYTYNGFEETVGAFKRVALILNDTGYWVIAAAILILSLVMGGMKTAAEGFGGAQVQPLAFVIPVIIGVAIVRGLLMPTGTIHVYDPVRNAYEAVDDVPDLIVLLAGGLNKVERGVADVIDTAALNKYSDTGGGSPFDLVKAAVSVTIPDTSLIDSLESYYADCGVYAIKTGYNGASMQGLKRGASDLKTEFAKYNHPTLYTTIYTAANSAGTTMSCKDAWTNLNTRLDAAQLAEMKEIACDRAGFDSSVAAQKARCFERFDNLGFLFNGGSFSSTSFLNSVVIAKATMDALKAEDPDMGTSALINRQIMAEGFGSATALNDWVPKVRGFLTAMVMGIIPVAALFIMTPLFTKSLALMFGLFVWLSLWGIMDVVAAQMAEEAAVNAFSQITRYNLGTDAIFLTPEASIQAIGIFGKARGMALVMSTLVASVLFKFGGYALTSAATQMQDHVENIGENAGRSAYLPEERAAMMDRMSGSMGSLAAHNNNSFEAMAVADGRGRVEAGAGGEAYMESINSMSGVPSAYMQASGAFTGATAAGSSESTLKAAQTTGRSTQEMGASIGGFRATTDIHSALSEKKVLEEQQPGGVVGGAEVAGQTRAGETFAQGVLQDTVAETNNINPGSTQAAALTGVLNNAARISNAGVNTADETLNMYSIQSESHREEAEGFDAHTDIEKASFAEGADRALRANATREVFRDVGIPATQDGYTFEKAKTAGAGAAATDLEGSPVTAGVLTGAQSTASNMASYENLVNLLNFTGSEAGDIEAMKGVELMRQGSNVGLAISPERSPEILDALKEAGVDTSTIEKEALESGMKLDFTMGNDGNPVYVDASTGSKSTHHNLASAVTGRSVVKQDIEEDTTRRVLEDSVSLHTNTQILNDDETLNKVISNAFVPGSNEVANASQLDNFGREVSTAMSTKGFNENAAQTDLFTLSHGGSLGISGRAGSPPISNIGGQIEAGYSGSTNNVDQESQVITVDTINAGARDMLLESREKAVEEVSEKYGFDANKQTAEEALIGTDGDTSRYKEYIAEVDSTTGENFLDGWRYVEGALQDESKGAKGDSATDEEVAKMEKRNETEGLWNRRDHRGKRD